MQLAIWIGVVAILLVPGATCVWIARRVGRIRPGGLANRGDQRQNNQEQRAGPGPSPCAHEWSSDSGPVLSPTLSCGTPAVWSIVSSRFAIGVFSG